MHFSCKSVWLKHSQALQVLYIQGMLPIYHIHVLQDLHITVFINSEIGMNGIFHIRKFIFAAIFKH